MTIFTIEYRNLDGFNSYLQTVSFFMHLVDTFVDIFEKKNQFIKNCGAQIIL